MSVSFKITEILNKILCLFCVWLCWALLNVASYSREYWWVVNHCVIPVCCNLYMSGRWGHTETLLRQFNCLYLFIKLFIGFVPIFVPMFSKNDVISSKFKPCLLGLGMNLYYIWFCNILTSFDDVTRVTSTDIVVSSQLVPFSQYCND